MRWFENTFLPSLFERAGVNNKLWLTAKQAEICSRYMEKHASRYTDDGIRFCSHVFYTCCWNDRSVILDVSKKNGCGCIEFYMNSAESAEAAARAAAEKEKLHAERIERAKRNPERLAQRIAKINAKIASIEAAMAADIEDGEMEYIEEDRAEIEKLRAELEALLA